MSLIKFIKNISYLFSHQLKKEIKLTDNIEILVEEIIIEKLGNKIYGNIKDIFTTIDILSSSNKSIVRFGDGEIQLIKGFDIPCQKGSSLLSNRLKEIISSRDENILIAVPTFIYTSKKRLNNIPRIFWSQHGKLFRDEIDQYISDSHVYYAAEFTIAADAYINFDIETYFEKLKRILNDKDITIICGRTVFSKIKFNIFDNARSIQYLYAPSVNAFEEYDNILYKASNIDKNRIIVLILGPTAKILAFDLAKIGFRALDLGHVAKSYDWYKKGKNTLRMKDATEFFNPD